MKKALAIIFSLVTLVTTLHAQTQQVARRVNNFGAKIPQEKVFLHIDNNAYFLGDTIRYKAYVTRSDNGRLSTISGVLYVELLNTDGYLVERQIIQLQAGMGQGAFVLGKVPPYYSGYHELRAYTRWMLNFGRTELPHSKAQEQLFLRKHMAEEYFLDYEKLYSRVFPVYDAPEAPGEYYTDITGRPMQRLTGDKQQKDPTTVTLYPEGGNITRNAPCRVFFEAATETGRHVRGTLTMRGPDGESLTAHTEHRGKGVIDLPPINGTWHASFTDDEGKKISVDVPKPSDISAALRADISGNTLNIGITAGKTESELAVTIMHTGMVRHYSEVRHNDNLTLSLDTLPPGVLDVTVFDADGRILADRLVFNNCGLAATNLTVDGIQSMYEPFAPIDLTIRRTEPSDKTSVLSVAITDDANSKPSSDNGNIMTELLLCSEIRGFVEEPGYYFAGSEPERLHHLDLLMATQGWRRFDWQTQTNTEAFELAEINEAVRPRMDGAVYNYNATKKVNWVERAHELDMIDQRRRIEVDKPDKLTLFEDEQSELALQDLVHLRTRQVPSDLPREVRVHASFTSSEKKVYTGDVTTTNARFNIVQPDIDGEFYMHLAAVDTTKVKNMKKYSWVDARESEYPPFYVRIREFHPRHPKPFSFYQTQLVADPVEEIDTTYKGSFDDRIMSQVTIRRKRGMLRKVDTEHPAVMMAAHKAFNMVCDAGVCPGYFIGGDRFAVDVARVLVDCDMGVPGSWPAPGTVASPKLWSAIPEFCLQVRYGKKIPAHRKPTEEESKGAGGDGANIPEVLHEDENVWYAYKWYMDSFTDMSHAERDEYNQLQNIDSVFIYTDYAPRKYRNPEWNGENQPHVTVDLRRMPLNTQRMTYRDRFYTRPGFNQCEEFYSPDYSKRKPSSSLADTRRTLMWIPYLMFDNDGKAQVKAWNNGTRGAIRVMVNGIDSSGTPLAN